MVWNHRLCRRPFRHRGGSGLESHHLKLQRCPVIQGRGGSDAVCDGRRAARSWRPGATACEAGQGVCRKEHQTLLSETIVVDAIKVQNDKHAHITIFEIDRLDAGFIERTDKKLIDSKMNNPLAAFLRDKKAAAGGVIFEIFIVDDKGLNVARPIRRSTICRTTKRSFRRRSWSDRKPFSSTPSTASPVLEHPCYFSIGLDRHFGLPSRDRFGRGPFQALIQDPDKGEVVVDCTTPVGQGRSRRLASEHLAGSERSVLADHVGFGGAAAFQFKDA
jgi:hypothetical protein